MKSRAQLTSRRFWRGLGLLVGLGALAVAAHRLALPDCGTIQGFVTRHGAVAPVVYFFAYVLATIAMVPGLIITLVAGAIWGPLWGTLLSSISAMAAATAAFFLARSALRPTVEAYLTRQRWYAPFQSSLRDNGLEFVLLLRLAPLVPYNAANYACGLLPLKKRDYLLGSLMGMLPGSFAYCYMGAAGCQAFVPLLSGGVSLKTLPHDVFMKFLVASLLLALLSLVPTLMKRCRRKPPITA